MLSNNQEAFFALVRAGLWEKEVRLSSYGEIDYKEVYRIAQEQSVVGLLAAGLEHIIDVKLSKDVVLQVVGEALQIERRNQAMNVFIGALTDRMRRADIYTLMVKGQGVAQCYERPQWRASGDIDLYLSESNYDKAKDFLTPLAQHTDEEDKRRKHYSMTIEQWVVELHGTMYTDLSKKVNNILDEVHKDLFYGGNVRSWMNDNMSVFLPSANNDAIILFTHFLGHFYGPGIGLRQICDWCRLLWKYKDELNLKLLKNQVNRMGLMTEWLVFESFAVDYLGMPEYILLVDEKKRRYCKKAVLIAKLILIAGNMGHNKDESYKVRHSGLVLNLITLWRRICEYSQIFPIFPINAPKFFLYYISNRL